MCLCMMSRIFWCLDLGDSFLQVGGLTYLPPWKSVTNHAQGIKLRNNLHPSSFLLVHLWKNIAQNFKPLVLAESPYFHGLWCSYLTYNFKPLILVGDKEVWTLEGTCNNLKPSPPSSNIQLNDKEQTCKE